MVIEPDHFFLALPSLSKAPPLAVNDIKPIPAFTSIGLPSNFIEGVIALDDAAKNISASYLVPAATTLDLGLTITLIWSKSILSIPRLAPNLDNASDSYFNIWDSFCANTAKAATIGVSAKLSVAKSLRF